MVGAMTLKLAQGAKLLEMTRYGVAAGSATTINRGTRLCSLADTQKLSITCPEINPLSFALKGKCSAKSPNTHYRLC